MTVLRAVSVVVTTYSIHAAERVLRCVRSLKNQTLKPTELILVLDPDEVLTEFFNASAPEGTRIVVSDDFGLSNARNTGIRSASGEIVAFIDDDATADKTWLETLANSYDDPSVVCVGGFVEPVWEGGQPAWFPAELSWLVGCSYEGLPKYTTQVRNPIGCNMSFRKSVFYSVGHFRTSIGRFGRNLISGEETELCIRIIAALPSAKILYNPGAVVYHEVPKSRISFRYIIRRSFYEGFSIATIVNSTKHSPTRIMSVENSYLRYLLRRAIPSRLKEFYDLRKVCQLLALSTSVYFVAFGFGVGKLFRKS